MLYTHIQNRNFDCTAINVGHANTYRFGENISSIDGIKGLPANCRLASCLGSYATNTQSHYHGITLLIFYVLLVLSILLTKAAKFWCLLPCLCRRAVEQTVETMQVSRKLMKLRLCYSYVICNSVIDDFTVPVGDETTDHQWIPVARDHWSGALMVQCEVIRYNTLCIRYQIHVPQNTPQNNHF